MVASISLFRILILVVVILLLPQPVEAQEDSVYSEDVLEITPEVMGRFLRGVEAMQGRLREIESTLASTGTPEAYEACMIPIALSPEYMRFLEEMGAMAERGDMAGIGRVTEQMERMVMEQCGPDPSNIDSSRARLEEQADSVGFREAGLTERQWSIIKERVVPLCVMEELELEGDGSLVIGSDPEFSYVYGPREVAAIRPRCPVLLQAFPPYESGPLPDPPGIEGRRANPVPDGEPPGPAVPEKPGPEIAGLLARQTAGPPGMTDNLR